MEVWGREFADVERPHAALRQELDARLQAELKKIGDDFRPRQYYLDKWGYTIARHGSIAYEPGAKVQSPWPQPSR